MRLTSAPGSAIVASVLVALLLTGCGLGGLLPGASSSGGGPSGSGAAFNPSGDARRDLGDALRKLKTAYPYRLTETYRLTGTASGTANGQTAVPEAKRVSEFAAPDRSHMKITGGAGGDVEMINIGDKQYWYAGGKWTEGSRPSSAERAKKGVEMEKFLAEATKDVKYVGAEIVGGVPCHAYTYTLEMKMSGQNFAGTGKAWVGAADGLPHQIDSELSMKGYFTQKSHIVYEYNVPIKVEKPVP